MICVLSLTPPVVSPDGGFFDLPLAHAQCCFTAAAVSPGSADSVYNLILDGDHSYVANDFVIHNKGGGQGDDSQSSDDTSVVGMILAANSSSVEEGATASGGSTGAGSTGDADATSTDSGSGEFSGSSAPAGPDLTSSEEQNIISSGWK